MRYKVTERQVVHYTWFVDADDQETAEESAQDGVPDDAESKLKSSEVEAEPWEHYEGDNCTARHEWVEARRYLACGESFMAGTLCSLPAGHLEDEGTNHQ